MSDELSNTEKAKLVFSILKGDITLEDVCACTSVAPVVVRDWIKDAIASVGSRRAVYEKLAKIKTRVNMLVLPGGSLACIYFHEREAVLGEKSDYWCSPVQLADHTDGELILNYSRNKCKLEEIDIAFSHLCLPPKFAGSETSISQYAVEMELNFKRKTATIRFARPDKIQFQGGPLSSVGFVLPEPLIGTVLVSIDNTSKRLYNIRISHADQILPAHFFAPDETK